MGVGEKLFLFSLILSVFKHFLLLHLLSNYVGIV